MSQAQGQGDRGALGDTLGEEGVPPLGGELVKQAV